MKKLSIILAIFLSAGLLHAQRLDRSVRPSAAPAPEIHIKDAKIFTLSNGLKVFVVEDHKLPIVYYSLSLDVKPPMEGAKAGLEEMYSSVFGTATTTRTKEEINESFDLIGASFFVGGRNGFARGLKKHEGRMLELMADVLFNPVFKQEELDLALNKAKSGFAYLANDGGQIASRVAPILRYGNKHPYGEAETLESLNNIAISDLQAFYNTYFAPNVTRLVIVGDITEAEAKANAEKYFGSWKKKDVKQATFPMPTAPEGVKVAMVTKEGIPQSFINITYPIELAPGAADLLPAQITNYVLGGGMSSYLFQNLRETHSFTYGVYSSISPDELVGNFSLHAGRGMPSVKGAATDSAIYQTLYEMRRIANEPINEKMLTSAKASFAGSFSRSLQDPATIARFAVSIDKYKLPKDYYKTYLKRLDAVTVANVQTAAKKYVKSDNAWIIVVGDKSHAESLKQFASDKTVQFYDMNGKPVETSTAKAIDANITPELIINKYVDAIGGKANIEKINDYKMVSEMVAMGQKMDMTNVFRKPNQTAMSIGMGGMVVQKIVFDGNKLKMSGMQGSQELAEGNEFEMMRLHAGVCPEMSFVEKGYTLELKGIEQVNGKDAYAISISKGSTSLVSYFDVATGLKVKSTSNVETPQGTIQQITEFADYQAVEGVKFPFSTKQSAAGMVMESKVKQLDVNKGVSDADFN